MALDCTIVPVALPVRAPPEIAWPVQGAVVLNMTLAINHRPGRCMAFLSGSACKAGRLPACFFLLVLS